MQVGEQPGVVHIDLWGLNDPLYEQKLTAGDLDAVKVLKRTSPVAWRDVNLIGNFDFTTSSTPVDIEALAAHYQNDDFWRRSMQEDDEEGPER